MIQTIRNEHRNGKRILTLVAETRTEMNCELRRRHQEFPGWDEIYLTQVKDHYFLICTRWDNPHVELADCLWQWQ